MARFTTTAAVKKQWQSLIKKENKFIESNKKEPSLSITSKIEEKIPDNLQNMLNGAFNKAFALIFEKGTKAIELTYFKKWHQEDFDHHTEEIEKKHNGSNLKAFSKKARETRSKNLVFSGIEGIGFGIIGAGIPDIPVLTVMILKGIYEVALSYGFSYEDPQERIFILKLIQSAMSHGEDFLKIDKEINQWIHNENHQFKTELEDQIKATSESISTELLITKFIQGIPVAGVAGGVYDVVYLNKITKYADLKYQRRFLFSKFKKMDA